MSLCSPFVIPGVGNWRDWPATLTGATLGNGSIDARYTEIGNTCIAQFVFTLGPSSAIVGNFGVTPPITPLGGGVFLPIGVARSVNAGVQAYAGDVAYGSGFLFVGVPTTSGAYAGLVPVSPGVPIVFGVADSIGFTAIYEVA